jgi:surfactin synthase thioesterase subunit
LPNPAGGGPEAFRRTRDELAARVRALVAELTGGGS